MAIVHRQGDYPNFDPTKMLPGEWAVVLSGDPDITDGRAVYICFAAGDVKRMATHNDMLQQFNDINSDLIIELTEGVNTATANANSATEYANRAGNNAYSKAQEAELAANEAAAIADDLDARLESGEFTGPVGPVGPAGADGANAAVTTLQGQFAFQVQNGHLMLIYPDDTTTPDFKINESGHLIYTI